MFVGNSLGDFKLKYSDFELQIKHRRRQKTTRDLWWQINILIGDCGVTVTVWSSLSFNINEMSILL